MDVNSELKEQVAHIQEKVPVIIDQLPIYIDWGMRLLSATLILVAGWIIGNWISNRIQRIKRLDETLAGFLGHTAKYIIMAVAFITILGQFGVQTASLLAVLGAVGLAVGLALQGTLSNVAAGTMLLILRPFKVGDTITAGAISGTVKSLSLFGTELATAENVYIFAPNSMIWNTSIWNFNRFDARRQDLNIRIGYDQDIGAAITCIQRVLDADDRVVKSPDDRKPQVIPDAMGDFAIHLIVRFWAKTIDFGDMRGALTKSIREALAREGIMIPLPASTVEMIAIDRAAKKAAA